MPDSTTNRHGTDPRRINVNQDYELRDWSKKFGVTPDELKRAVAAVGDSADAVQKHLQARAGTARS